MKSFARRRLALDAPPSSAATTDVRNLDTLKGDLAPAPRVSVLTDSQEGERREACKTRRHDPSPALPPPLLQAPKRLGDG